MSQAHDKQARQSLLSASRKTLLEKWRRGKGGMKGSEIAAIPPRKPGEEIPLSFAQQRLWFLDQLEPGNAFYNGSVVIALSGNVQIELLEKSLHHLIQRHESLRTVFSAGSDQPVQVIDPGACCNLTLIDLASYSATLDDRIVQDLIGQEVQRPFDLAYGPLLRTTLIRLNEQSYLLLLVMHHIISDGWSEMILLRELAAFYNGFCDNRPVQLAPLPIQAADFAIWQRQSMQGETLKRQVEYWKQQLADMPTKMDLPTDYSRPAEQTYRGARLAAQLPAALSADVKRLSTQEDVTLFMTLLAAFQVLLYRYTGQTDVVVGTPVANRGRPEIEGLIGLFLNTLVIRTDLAKRPTFREVLRRVRRVTLDAFSHQDTPFEAIVAELQPERNLSHNVLFQVLFVLQEAASALPPMKGLTLTRVPVETKTAKFDLTVEMVETERGLVTTIEYNTDLFASATVERLLGHWETLLSAIVADPGLPVTDYAILRAAEQRRQLIEWNDTQKDYALPESLPQLIEQQASATPDRIALVFQDEQVSYAELDHRATQLARYLQQHNIGADMLVGICMERSIEMVIGLLGILKAGGAYVPVDPSYPAERLAFMLADSQVSVLLTQQRLQQRLSLQGDKLTCLCLDSEWEHMSQGANEPLRRLIQPENLAYMIYTSGSTGTPKGAMNTHRAICNRLLWMQDVYQLGANDTVLQKTPFSFDVSVWEFFWPLLAGARLVMAVPDGHRDSQYLVSVIVEQAVTTLHFVPSMLHVFLEAEGVEECRSVHTVICSGEALPFELMRRFFTRLDAALENLYGPTESAVDVSFWSCSPEYEGSSVPIGRPIANVGLYILDAQLQPVPVGCIGELYIGGIGLARGYFQRPALTAERFVPHPFSAGGERLYRTGDLAYFLPDGTIVYAGRIDHQVKLRGFRIELGEIEKVISQHEMVKDCLVAVREERSGEKQLVAYVVIENEQGQDKLASKRLRRYLQEKLPEYMVPSHFVMLDALPLTPNGKVDHRALAKLEIVRENDEAYAAPRTALEDALATIWGEVLHLKRVGIHDNFFELGGDSILCLQIVARARQAGIHLTPKQFFKHQTIEKLSLVADEAAMPMVQAEQGAVVGPVPLTPIQRWFFDLQLSRPQHWNQYMFIELQEQIDSSLLERVCNALQAHHDALRLRFARTESGWQQSNSMVVRENRCARIDLSRLSSVKQDTAMSEIEEREQEQVQLDEGALLRVVLFDLGPQRKQRLLLIVHHLGVDGISWRILLEDLQRGYVQARNGEAISLPPKTTSFKQWAEQLVGYAQSSQLRQEQSFWLSDSYTRSYPLPVDMNVSEGNTVRSTKKVMVALTKQETLTLLEEAPKVYHTQINDILLTALALTIVSWTGVSVVRLDLEGHGREDLFAGVDLSRTVGWFTSLFPVVLDISQAATEVEVLRAVKEQLRHIPQRGIGFGVLRYLSREAGRLQELQNYPASQLLFNYLGQFEQSQATSSFYHLEMQTSGLSQAPEGMRPYLLEVNSWVNNGRLQVNWEYSENCYHRATIVGLAQKYNDVLCTLIQQCGLGDTTGYTPADFPEVELTQAQLENVLSEIDFGEEGL